MTSPNEEDKLQIALRAKKELMQTVFTPLEPELEYRQSQLSGGPDGVMSFSSGCNPHLNVNTPSLTTANRHEYHNKIINTPYGNGGPGLSLARRFYYPAEEKTFCTYKNTPYIEDAYMCSDGNPMYKATYARIWLFLNQQKKEFAFNQYYEHWTKKDRNMLVVPSHMMNTNNFVEDVVGLLCMCGCGQINPNHVSHVPGSGKPVVTKYAKLHRSFVNPNVPNTIDGRDPNGFVGNNDPIQYGAIPSRMTRCRRSRFAMSCFIDFPGQQNDIIDVGDDDVFDPIFTSLCKSVGLV